MANGAPDALATFKQTKTNAGSSPGSHPPPPTYIHPRERQLPTSRAEGGMEWAGHSLCGRVVAVPHCGQGDARPVDACKQGVEGGGTSRALRTLRAHMRGVMGGQAAPPERTAHEPCSWAHDAGALRTSSEVAQVTPAC